MALVAVFGAVLLAAGIARWHNRSVLMERGKVVTAQITEVHGGTGHGMSVTVRFATTAGEEIVADVEDPPVGPPLTPGASIQIRYDPRDPGGRVMPANENQSAISRWFLICSGVALLAGACYGTLWWAREARRRGVD